jgi:hypothetical protein
MGQVRALDIALNAKGYLRLSTPNWWVQHLGNTLTTWREEKSFSDTVKEFHPTRKSIKPLGKPLRRLLVWLNNKTFEFLYRY